ncbi:centromere protein I-like isoform X2 [Pseudomyrmex gracilis]|uniref:centromere protein I-like isoform X2 n=1 Tax=Pseudomyrmex gracilis TaxID=219809 RepID=UPI000994D82A|nr:centromere protein I-like isoform X2 [Pseudomyrmex gracilis]
MSHSKIQGLWDYELADRRLISIYYDVFFYMMLKKEKLERHLARLVYVSTRPEDVTRRDVLRLLNLQKKYSKPRAHITALLFLFKSYKPELVPEKINSVNIESVWKPIPENMRVALEDARDRAEIQQSQSVQTYFNWNVAQKTKKKKLELLPSVGYFHIGSSIFKSENAKLIFDINSIEDLGKYHQNVELPCKAISLLTNMAGYHLLTYADIQYQSRFSYNLYNTLIRAFILEREKFSEEQMDQFLAMTVEFSRYMQEGVLVTKLFFDEFLYYNTGEHLQKMLHLLEWMTSITVTELRENILIHVRNIFFESTLAMKCEIIKSLGKLITNLFVRQGLEESFTNVSCFLHQKPLENLSEIVSVITMISENLIVHGLNIHKYDVVLLSESLTFYEEICTLESRSHIVSWTLAPPAVIYGAFVTKSCAILSRVCTLLLRYREMSSHFRQILPANIYKEKVHIISIYALDIYKALWQDEPFSNRKDGYFLRNVSEKVIRDLDDCDLDSSLSISNHYAVLPYKYTINTTGLSISTKQAAMSMALYYYPAINKFISAFDAK